MSDIRSAMADPKLLLEAARVFNAAGRDYRGAAEVVAELALQAKGTAEARVQQAIIGDAAALRLSRRVPGGYRAALELLKSIDDDEDGRLHLLRALAHGQKYTQTPQEARGQLCAEILADLKIAVDRNPELRATLPHFWRPSPAALVEGADLEDDLQAVYLDNPRLFEELINPPAAGSTGATGGQAGATGTSTQIS
ncbi:MAG: hypothetical protein JOZ66_17290 [Hyphomicrobiales bacterium]|nr:hypothetical protein [Hyphomicrobiales bacterium]